MILVSVNSGARLLTIILILPVDQPQVVVVLMEVGCDLEGHRYSRQDC